MKKLSRAFLLAAVTLLIAGVIVEFGLVPLPDPRDDLVLESPRKSFGTASVGEVFEVGIMLTNVSSRPIRLLGSDFNCTKEGCLRIEGLPWTIPPHSRRELKIQVKTQNSGQFATQLSVFTDCDSMRKFEVGIDGIVNDSS